MSRVINTAGALLFGLAATFAAPAWAQEEPQLKDGHFPFNGIFGTYDRGALQRGYQIYDEVCSNCHSLSLLSYRNLADLGFTPEEVKALAAAKQVTLPDGNTRPATPADHFVPPNPAVISAFSAKPPDLSVITKARDGGANYVYSLVQGYANPPQGMTLLPGIFYNEIFPGHQIAMPPPLTPDRVQYADGTQASLDQEAHDVASFLNWASEPELERRHRLGI